MRTCYFRGAAPAVEVRGELIFVMPEGAPHEVAIEQRTASLFAAALQRAVRELSERRGADVVPIRARG